MNSRTIAKHLVSAATAFSLLIPALPVRAATTTVTTNADFAINGTTFRVMGGSVYDSLSVADGAMNVTVPAGEAFEARLVGSTTLIENNVGMATCDVIRDPADPAPVNRILLVGPSTATLRPGIANCTTSGVDLDGRSRLTIGAPGAGSTVKAGTQALVLWSLSGHAVTGIRLRLSTDGGATYPHVLADNAYNNGYFQWNVPADMVSTVNARFKIDGYDSGRIVAFALGPVFTIDGVPAPAQGPITGGTITVEAYDYDPATETLEAETIGIDRHLPSRPEAQICVPETRIKAKGHDAVYYCAHDGKRYVFPNRKTYDTWYDGDFRGVVELELADVQRIPLGGNVTYRPGVSLVKVQTSPEVFVVAADGILRYVTEEQAIRLYGADWQTKVDDIPEAFFVDYQIGEAVK